MTYLFDTHAHLMDEAFSSDYEEVLQRTLSQTGAVMNVGCSFPDAKKALESAQAHSQIFAALSLHPSDAYQFNEEDWQSLAQAAEHPRVRAIGETGLDYHWDTSTKEQQYDVFVRHIELAKALNKPLIIHDREAHRDSMDILWGNQAEEIGGVFHAFSGSVEMMEELIDHNFYLGIGGVVTFKNAKTIKAVAQAVPLDRLLLETDCPYMTPTPFRGKRNEPAYTHYVAQSIAELRGMAYDDILTITWENACRFFKLNPNNLTLLS